MTKKEVLKDFMEHVYPHVVSKYGKNDKIALAEEWSYYTDSLCKEGKITLKQYESWTNPF